MTLQLAMIKVQRSKHLKKKTHLRRARPSAPYGWGGEGRGRQRYSLHALPSPTSHRETAAAVLIPKLPKFTKEVDVAQRPPPHPQKLSENSLKNLGEGAETTAERSIFDTSVSLLTRTSSSSIFFPITSIIFTYLNFGILKTKLWVSLFENDPKTLITNQAQILCLGISSLLFPLHKCFNRQSLKVMEIWNSKTSCINDRSLLKTAGHDRTTS